MSDQITHIRVRRFIEISGPIEWVVGTLARSWVAPNREPRLDTGLHISELSRSLRRP